MAQSPYNIFLPSGREGTEILLNSFSRTLCELSAADAAAVRAGSTPPTGTEHVLKGMGAITDSPETQRAAVFAAFREEQWNTRELNIVLPLTTSCNLKCTYCYQVIHGDFQGRTAVPIPDWNQQSIDSLAEFVSRELGELEYISLRVRWYGGEPLLRLDLIEKIGTQLARMTSLQKKELTGMVVTNGLRLTDDAIKVLHSVHVDRLEISVDGPQETHDTVRPKGGGQGSYDEVMTAIDRAAESFPSVVFRVNVHSRNAPFIEEWLATIAPRIRRQNIFLKFKLVEGDKSNEMDWVCFSQWSLHYIPMAKALGLNVLQKNLVTELCPAIRRNYYIVQSDLRVYKCPQNLGSADHVGMISVSGVFEETTRLKHWVNYDVEKRSDCRPCAHLPHCNGGCPYNEIMAGINSSSLTVYQRKETCCREKIVPELLVARLL